MSETKFTNGPWNLGDDYRLPSGRTVVAGDCLRIADVMERNSHLSREECEANASIIAAAPELYDVLQMYVSAYSLGFPSPNILVEAGQKALAKARGES